METEATCLTYDLRVRCGNLDANQKCVTCRMMAYEDGPHETEYFLLEFGSIP